MQNTETLQPPESIHGHDVLDILLSAPTPLRRAELTAEVNRRFGPDARFHTCSASAMTLDHLLMFLLTREKIVERDGRLSVNAANVCQH